MHSNAQFGAREALELADWRRSVADLYATVRSSAPEEGWRAWCAGRERLFADHPQSPLPASRRTADHLPRYFPYDPALRVVAGLDPQPHERVELPSSDGRPMPASRIGVARFVRDGRACSVAVFWLDGYAGGLFMSFRDSTSGTETYGGGRYLLDTAKGADLGEDGGQLILDFNFAYQPSCSYDGRWGCPLPPRSNWLDVPIRGGEGQAGAARETMGRLRRSPPVDP